MNYWTKITFVVFALVVSIIVWTQINNLTKPAVKWYRLAAEQGHHEAQTNLGSMYSKGQGVPQDDKEAIKWWRLAVEQGCVEAQCNLGGMYYEGIGVTTRL